MGLRKSWAFGNKVKMQNSEPQSMQKPEPQSVQESELAELIVTTLNLEVAPSSIDPMAPLYDEGLGLDSIDILEIALTVSKVFGVKLRAGDKNNVAVFGSLRSLSHYIHQHRTI
jgi:acyl carrier protein